MKLYLNIFLFLLSTTVFSQQLNIQIDSSQTHCGWEEGMTVPNLYLRDIDNRQYELYDLADKMVLIDFWFTSCKPCIKNKRYLKQFYRQYDIQIISISVDQRASIIKKHVTSNDILWINIHDNAPFQERFKFKITENHSYPDYILITPDKKIFKFYHSGGDIAKIGISLQEYFKTTSRDGQ